jgi:hypothetical protein
MNDTERPISLDLVISESNTPLAIDPRKGELVATLNPLVSRIGEYEAKAGMIVANAADADEASRWLDLIARDTKTVEAAIKDFKVEAKRRHSLWCDVEALFTDSFKASYKKLKTKVMDWQAAEQEKAERERQRLQAIADEAARKERERLEKLAEQRKTPETKEEYREAAAAVVAPVIRVDAPKAAVKMTLRWAVKSFDMTAMGVPREVQGYITVETNKLARAKAANTLLEVPGVAFWQVRV